MVNSLIRSILLATALFTALGSTGCVVVQRRGRGWHGHPHGGPPGHTGIHPGHGHGR